MGLETATYINELNPLWPLDNDFIREADDHMRLIKSTVQNSFPNITGPVNATQAELNLLVGSTTLNNTPGGLDTHVQFNQAGLFGGSSNFTFDGTQVTAAALLVLGLTTIGFDDVNAEGLVRAGVSGSMYISGGSSQTSGAHITLNSNGNMDFEANADGNFMEWNNVTGALTINKGIGGGKTLGATFDPIGFVLNNNNVAIRSADSGDPTAAGTITAALLFQSQDPNDFGKIAYQGTGNMDIVNVASDADLNLFTTDGTSFSSDYGITINSKGMSFLTDVNLLPTSLIDLDSTGATVIADAAINFNAYLKAYPDAGPATDGYALAWNDANGRMELTSVGGGGGGDVFKVGTPVNNQIGIWTGDGTIQGDSTFTYTLGTSNLITMNAAGGVRVVNTDGILYIQDNNSVHPTGTPRVILEASGGEKGRMGVSTGNIVELQSSFGGVSFNPGFLSGDQTVELEQGGLVFNERADHASTPSAGKGEIWMRTDNELIFTDDTGTDNVLTGGGGGGTIGGSIDDNQIAVGAAVANDIEGSTAFTFNGNQAEILGTTPAFKVIKSGEAVDEGAWGFYSLGSEGTFRAMDDVGVGGGPVWSAFRTGTGTQVSHMEVYTQIRAGGGNATVPDYGFRTSNDTNTGMYRVGEDQLGFTTGGSNALTINASQESTFANNVNVGDGTLATINMDVNGSAGSNPAIRLQQASSNKATIQFVEGFSEFRIQAVDTGDALSFWTAGGERVVIGGTSGEEGQLHLVTGDLEFTERADHNVTAPAAGKGYVWVRNDSPNKLIFTDDTGVDHDLTAGGGGGIGGSIADNQIAIGAAVANDIEGSANLTFDGTALDVNANLIVRGTDGITMDIGAVGNTTIHWDQNAIQQAYIQYVDTGNILRMNSNGPIEFNSNNTLALTLTSTQNATFAGNIFAPTINLDGGSATVGNAAGPTTLVVSSATSNARINVDGNLPQIRWDEADAGLDQKIWEVRASGEAMSFAIYDDAIANLQTWLQVERSGTGAGIQVDTVDFTVETDVTFNTDAVIVAAGDLVIDQGQNLRLDGLIAGDTYITSNFADRIDFVAGGTARMHIYGAANGITFNDEATFAEQVKTPFTTASRASLNVPHGTAPTTPADGDIWTTTAGLFVRINGVTVGPLS